MINFDDAEGTVSIVCFKGVGGKVYAVEVKEATPAMIDEFKADADFGLLIGRVYELTDNATKKNLVSNQDRSLVVAQYSADIVRTFYNGKVIQ